MLSLTLINTKFRRKSEEFPDSKSKSRHAETRNLWAAYFKNNWNEQDLIKDLPALILKKKTVYNSLERWEQKELLFVKLDQAENKMLANYIE